MKRVSISSLVVGIAVLGMASAMAPALAQDPVKVAPKAFTERLANDSVRVLEYQSKPGDKEVMHAHSATVLYVIAGGKLRYTFPDGKTSEVEVKAGDVTWREAIIHAVENVGKTEVRALLVEVKPAKK